MNLDLLRMFIAIFLEVHILYVFIYFQEKAEREWKLNIWFEQNRPLIDKCMKAVQREAEWVQCPSDYLLKWFMDLSPEEYKKIRDSFKEGKQHDKESTN